MTEPMTQQQAEVLAKFVVNHPDTTGEVNYRIEETVYTLDINMSEVPIVLSPGWCVISFSALGHTEAGLPNSFEFEFDYY